MASDDPSEHLGQAALHTAGQLMQQYGEDAEVIATLRAAEVAAMGDVAALEHWDRVIEILSQGPQTTN